MFIAPFIEEDLEDVAELEPPDWDDLMAKQRWYMSTPYCIPLKAVFGEALISGAANAILHEGSGWIGSMHIVPRFKDDGVDTMLVRALIEQMETRGANTISVIATMEQQALYAAEGFEVETEYLHFADGEQDAPTEDEVELYEPHHALGMLHLDRRASGEDRRTLISEHSYAGRIYVRNQRVLGYMLPILGEALVIAQDPHSGLELLRWQLPILNKVCVPQENIAAVEYLVDHKYVEYKRTIRMYRGKKLEWHPEWLYSRISDQLG